MKFKKCLAIALSLAMVVPTAMAPLSVFAEDPPLAEPMAASVLAPTIYFEEHFDSPAIVPDSADVDYQTLPVGKNVYGSWERTTNTAYTEDSIFRIVPEGSGGALYHERTRSAQSTSAQTSVVITPATAIDKTKPVKAAFRFKRSSGQNTTIIYIAGAAFTIRADQNRYYPTNVVSNPWYAISLPANQWHNVEIEIDYGSASTSVADATASFYVNGTFQSSCTFAPKSSNNNILIQTVRNGYVNANAGIWIDDIVISDIPRETEDLACEYAQEEIEAWFANPLKSSLTLPSKWTTTVDGTDIEVDVAWSSNNTGVIDNTGKITRTAGIGTAELTVTTSKATFTNTLKYDVTVAALPEFGELLVEGFDINASSSEGTALGGYNGWTAEGDATASYTLGVEADVPNGVAKLARNAESQPYYISKNLTESYDGGKVALEMRVKRDSANANELTARITDGSIDMGFVIDLAKSKIIAEQSGAFADFYFNDITADTACVENVWQYIKWIFDLETMTFDCYHGISPSEMELIANDCNMIASMNKNISAISIGAGETGENSFIYVDDVLVGIEERKKTDAEACAGAATQLDGWFKDKTTYLQSSLTLPTKGLYGTVIEWESSDDTVIDSTGKITRAAEDKTAELTATITRGTASPVEVGPYIIKVGAGPSEDKILFKDEFTITDENPIGTRIDNEVHSSSSAPLEGYNKWLSNWGTYQAGSWDNMDAIFALAEESVVPNGIASFYRAGSGDRCVQHWITHNLDRNAEGGTVSMQMRIRRENEAAKIFKVSINDGATNTSMGFDIYFDTGKIKSAQTENGQPVFPDFSLTDGKTPVGQWYYIKWDFNLDIMKFDCYVGTSPDNMVKGLDQANIRSGLNSRFTRISIETHRSSNGTGAQFYMDDLVIWQSKPPITDGDALDIEAEALMGDYANIDITSDMKFPALGIYKSRIIWAPVNDDDVVKLENNVLIVTPGNEDIVKTFRVNIYRNQEQKTIEIPLIIKAKGLEQLASQNKVDAFAENFTFSNVSDEDILAVTENLNLMTEADFGSASRFGGVNVSWASDKPHVIAPDGTVVQYQYNASVKLSATFTAKTDSSYVATKTFNVVVPCSGDEIISEDNFDAAELSDMNKRIDYNGWVFNRGDEGKGDSSDGKIEFDDAEIGNKFLHVTRSKAGANEARQTITKTFNPQSSGMLVMSFRFKFGTSGSRVGLGVIDSDGQVYEQLIGQNGTVFGNNTWRNLFTNDYLTNVLNLSSGQFKLNTWYNATFICRLNDSGSGSHTMEIYLNNVRLHANRVMQHPKAAKPINTFYFYSERQSDASGASWFVDDFVMRKYEDNNRESVSDAVNAITVNEAELSGGKLNLAQTGLLGTSVRWYSSDESVIGADGTVYRSDSAKNVTLTAIITRGSEKQTKTFDITVPANTGVGTGFTVNGVTTGPDGSITAVNVTGDGTVSAAKLVVMQYDRGSLVAARTADVTTISGTSAISGFAALPASTGEFSEYKIYVWDIANNKIVSNTYEG